MHDQFDPTPVEEVYLYPLDFALYIEWSIWIMFGCSFFSYCSMASLSASISLFYSRASISDFLIICSYLFRIWSTCLKSLALKSVLKLMLFKSDSDAILSVCISSIIMRSNCFVSLTSFAFDCKILFISSY